MSVAPASLDEFMTLTRVLAVESSFGCMTTEAAGFSARCEATLARTAEISTLS